MEQTGRVVLRPRGGVHLILISASSQEQDEEKEEEFLGSRGVICMFLTVIVNLLERRLY